MKNEDIEYDGESSEIKSLLEDKFGEFIDDGDVPDDIKKEVFSSLNTLTLIGDLADLFTVKFAKTNMNIIGPYNEDLPEIPDE